MDIAHTIGYIIIVVIVILLSMTLHEAMHGFVGYWLGDDTAKLQGRLTLNPLKHLDPFLSIILPILLILSGLPAFGGAKPVPLNPSRVKWGEWGFALVALAGPLTNLVLAFIAFGIFALLGLPASSTILGSFLSAAISVNLGFFIFNIIPIPPLDGSRVLYALAPDFVQRGMRSIERFGIIIVFLLVMVASPLLGQFMYTVISFFVSVFSHIYGV